MKLKLSLVAAVAVLAACSKSTEETLVANSVTTNGVVPAGAPPSPAATATAATPTIAGFDPASAPPGTEPAGAWPYFGMMDGYEKFDTVNIAGRENKKYLEDVGYDRTDFFDGTKLIPVEGRTMITGGLGSSASFFQVQKSYEKLVKDMGGVTVYEGTGKPMEDRKLKFQAARFRGQYELGEDEMGVYMVRTPTRQIWVEVYHPWEDNSKNYWLTIVETKPLEVKVRMIPAAEMKSNLDSQGHVALYFTFDTDKAAIRPENQPLIAEIVKLMTSDPKLKLTIEGHTDNAGSPDHNQALSLGRANSVMGALIAAGISPDRVQARGFGATRPVADNATDEGKAKNRRVELVKR
ncbi:OmpA family protein [uncultured Sphingomonas sp.]|uniref:OmpA family protein n=1 Tax=uncultured Sphingomonas sp. TaxID=158754 RepID=UPI0035CB9AE9